MPTASPYVPGWGLSGSVVTISYIQPAGAVLPWPIAGAKTQPQLHML